MCVLCGDLILNTHWSDNKKSSNTSVVVGEEQRLWVKNRREKIQFLNKILAFYGLNIRDWNTSKFTLFDKKGNCVIVNSLGDLWQKASELSKERMDILDEKLLEYLKSR